MINSKVGLNLGSSCVPGARLVASHRVVSLRTEHRRTYHVSIVCLIYPTGVTRQPRLRVCTDSLAVCVSKSALELNIIISRACEPCLYRDETRWRLGAMRGIHDVQFLSLSHTERKPIVARNLHLLRGRY